nr:MAG TPA: hypothetical protein [Caudoviricetes sp.]
MRGLKVQTTIRTPFNQSQMQKCTCDFLHPTFDLCGGEA